MSKGIIVGCVYILFLCNTFVQCADRGNGVKCNSTTPCPGTFTCEHYEGCQYGECVCLEPWFYLDSSKTFCMKRASLPGSGELCPDGVCQENLVCKKCEHVFKQRSEYTCRKDTVPIIATQVAGKRHAAKCTTEDGCDKTYQCLKSDDCNLGICRCRPGYSFLGPDSPCLKGNTFPKIGAACIFQNERNICEGLTPCDYCPGQTTGTGSGTCVGRLIDYEKSTPSIVTTTPFIGTTTPSTKVWETTSHHGGLTNGSINKTDNANDSNVTPSFRKKPTEGTISPAIYVIIPIALILIGIAVYFVVRKMRTGDVKNVKYENADKPSEPI